MNKLVFTSLMLSIAYLFAACDKNESKADFRLSELHNPFLGKWQSDIPSVHMTLIFDYKTDGTFTYEMVGVPPEQGGAGTGGYLVNGNIMVTFLDFEGIAGYTFKVMDNNTIDVTEINEVKEGGELVLGNMSPFTRVASSTVITENQATILNNPFLGKWQSLIPNEENPENPYNVMMEYKADGTGIFSFAGTSTEAGYFVINDKLVTFTPEANEFEAFTFSVEDNNTINVTELIEVTQDGIVSGNTAKFVRIPN